MAPAAQDAAQLFHAAVEAGGDLGEDEAIVDHEAARVGCAGIVVQEGDAEGRVFVGHEGEIGAHERECNEREERCTY